ncbi:hypothetical protein [Psychroserpens burtonensis]|uniref:hypothetical protein n=1 Tax=Psychroserpens burtonensis TaxID=49278 RepID=UPI0012FAA4E7|nr:hypothetical protein [Psychroserpens burtonensis]
MLPELGISVGNWADLSHDYGILFKNNNLNNVSYHRVILCFNLNKKTPQAAFTF